MWDKNKDLFVSTELFFEPDATLKIEMIGGFVKQQKMGLDVKGSSQGNSHTPSS